jgi:hypothetical protein
LKNFFFWLTRCNSAEQEREKEKKFREKRKRENARLCMETKSGEKQKLKGKGAGARAIFACEILKSYRNAPKLSNHSRSASEQQTGNRNPVG